MRHASGAASPGASGKAWPSWPAISPSSTPTSSSAVRPLPRGTPGTSCRASSTGARSAHARQRRVLAKVGRADLGRAEVAAIQQVLLDTGAVHQLEGRITMLVETAVAALEAAPVTPDARAGLNELAHAVAWRER